MTCAAPIECAADTSLRDLIEQLADQLCQAVEGNFSFRVRLDAHDDTLEKLQMLVNFVLDSARRSTSDLARKKELAELLSDVTIAVNQAGRLEDAVRDAIQKVCQYADWTGGRAFAAPHIARCGAPGGSEGAELVPWAGWFSQRPQEEPDPAEMEVALGVLKRSGSADRPDGKEPCAWRGCGSGGGLCGAAITSGAARIGALVFRVPGGQRTEDDLADLLQQVGCTLGRLLERKLAEEQLRERSRLAALEKDVGMALTRGGSLREMLQDCCQALVQRANAAFARIWTVNDQEQMLELAASAGLYTHIDGGHARVPIGNFKIGLIAQEGKAYLTNDVQNDPRLHDRAWARREGMVAFAGHPLVISGRIVGVMALFARHPLSPVVLEALASVADAVALGIQRKRAEAQLELVHRQLLDASRRAGMAEIASSVLHNVGNVLNSLNVSASVIVDAVRQSRVARLVQAADLIRAHADGLGDFLTRDERGRLLPEYLIGLAEALRDEQAGVAAELGSLTRHIEHIKSIVSTQQAYARVAGVAETVDVHGVIEDALRMSSSAFERHHIEVVREYGGPPTVTLDRQKLLQILVNLIRNAKHAICAHGGPEKRVILRTQPAGEGRFRIEIIDTGVGIPPENLTRIFAHGFTTKRDGHGFGLHSSALAAQAMGGTLLAHSDGVGKGARFTLDLPMQVQEQPV